MFDKTMVKNLTSTIQHELGHGFGYWVNSPQYENWESPFKENWARWYTNWSYRK